MVVGEAKAVSMRDRRRQSSSTPPRGRLNHTCHGSLSPSCDDVAVTVPRDASVDERQSHIRFWTTTLSNEVIDASTIRRLAWS